MADNSGAKKLRVILVHGGSRRRFGHLSDIITASLGRPDGSYIRFDDNAAVVLDSLKTRDPVGTRIFGPIAREVKTAGYSKIASLAPEVL